MDDYELKCAAMGIITYMYLLNTEELPNFKAGDLMEIHAPLDYPTMEATMTLLSEINTEDLVLYDPYDEDDDE